jgi:hypothetical protein
VARDTQLEEVKAETQAFILKAPVLQPFFAWKTLSGFLSIRREPTSPGFARIGAVYRKFGAVREVVLFFSYLPCAHPEAFDVGQTSALTSSCEGSGELRTSQ